MSISGTLEAGGPLPSWLKLDAETGLLSIPSGYRPEKDVKIQFLIKYYEGTSKHFVSTIKAGEAPELKRVLHTVATSVKDASPHLDCGIKAILDEQLSGITASAPLGKVVKVLGRCQNLLRSSSVANFIRPGMPRLAARNTATPRTPQ